MNGRVRDRVRVGALLVAVAAVLPACSEGSDGPGDGPRRVEVVAGFYPLAYVAERVGGAAVTVTDLTPTGGEPHDLELTPRQVARLEDADLVLHAGDFQPAVADAVRGARALDVTTALRTGDDPHFWLDPTRMADLADLVAQRLTALDEPHAAEFRSRAAALRRDLVRLDAAYTGGLRTCARREMLVSHAAFGHLAARYRLRQVSLTGANPEAEPSPARLAEIRRLAARLRATTIFVEPLLPQDAARELAGDEGLAVAVLDPLEGLLPSGPADYLAVMRANLAALRTGLGCP